jgi:hypothetical protein
MIGSGNVGIFNHLSTFLASLKQGIFNCHKITFLKINALKSQWSSFVVDVEPKLGRKECRIRG